MSVSHVCALTLYSRRYLFFDAAEKQWAIGPNLGVAPYTLAVRSATHDPQTIMMEVDSDGERLQWQLTDGDIKAQQAARMVQVVCEAHTPIPTPAPTPAPTRVPTPVAATVAPTPFQNPWAYVEAVLTIEHEDRPFYTFQHAFRRGVSAAAQVPVSDARVLSAEPTSAGGTAVRFRLRVRHHLAICRSKGSSGDDTYDATAAETACTAEAMARTMAMRSYRSMLLRHLRADDQGTGALSHVQLSELWLSDIMATDANGKQMLSQPLESPVDRQRAVQQHHTVVQRSAALRHPNSARPNTPRLPVSPKIAAAVAVAVLMLCVGCVASAANRGQQASGAKRCGEVGSADAELGRIVRQGEGPGEEHTALLQSKAPESAALCEPDPHSAPLSGASSEEMERLGVLEKLVLAHDTRIELMRKHHEDAVAEQAREEADAFTDAFAGEF